MKLYINLMPLLFKEVGGGYCFWVVCPSVPLSTCLFVMLCIQSRMFSGRILKLHMYIWNGWKISGHIYFLFDVGLFSGVMPLFILMHCRPMGHNEILWARYLEKVFEPGPWNLVSFLGVISRSPDYWKKIRLILRVMPLAKFCILYGNWNLSQRNVREFWSILHI